MLFGKRCLTEQCLGDIPLAYRRGIFHALRQDNPVISLQGSLLVGGGDREGETWRIIRMDRYREKAVLDIKNSEWPLSGQHRGARQAWLEWPHFDYMFINLS